MEIMWGYKYGVKIYGVKVKFIKNVTFGIK